MISRSILQKIVLVGMGLLIVGCVLKVEPPTPMSEIEAKPSTTILTGETASLTIGVSGTDLQFEWTVLKGSLSDPSQPSVIYTAPDSPGPDTVTVKITN